MAIAILCIYSQWKNYTAFSISSNQRKVHSEWSVVSILSNHKNKYLMKQNKLYLWTELPVMGMKGTSGPTMKSEVATT